jgi:hypothetical protein
MEMRLWKNLKISGKKKKINIWGIEIEPGIHTAQSFIKGIF